MANNFNIVISASDKATSVMRKVNDSISQITRPITDVRRSAITLGRELKLNPVIKALSGVKNIAGGVFQSIAKVSPAMASLGSFGTAAGMASVAGVAKVLNDLAEQSARAGYEIKNTSNRLGISNQQLQIARGAAKMAGLSADDMTSSMTGLNKVLFDAKVGNSPFKATMDYLKVNFHETADGGYDLLAVMKDVSRAMAQQKTVMAKHSIAEAFGVDGLYNLLEKGPEEVEEAINKYKKTNSQKSDKEIGQDSQYEQSLNNLSEAAKGVKEAIGNRVAPLVVPIFDQMTEYLAKTSGLLKSDKFFSDHNKAFLDPVGYANQIGNRLPSGNSTAGWGRGGPPAGFGGSSDKNLPYNAPELNQYAADVEKRLGLPTNILNSIKNLGERSGSNAVSPKGARGVMQFMKQTWDQYGQGDPTDPKASIDAAGRYVKDLLRRYDGNVDAAITEYNGGVKQAQAVKAGRAPWKAETINYLNRVRRGLQESGGGQQAPTQTQNITLTLAGLPNGVTATAKSAGGENVPVRISHTMQALEPL